MTRPDGRPLWDPASTRIKLDDWFSYRDPNQLWQRTYFSMQAQAERFIDTTTNVAGKTRAFDTVDKRWIDHGLIQGYFVFGHAEYGLFRAMNIAAREALSDTLTNVIVFNAADKLRHAQAVSIFGLDIENALPGTEATAARQSWLDCERWQPTRRLVESVMVLDDWCETVVAVNCVFEPLLAEPLRREVFAKMSARAGDPVTPVITGTATSDWLRNATWTAEMVRFVEPPGGSSENKSVVRNWVKSWTERVEPIANDLFMSFAETLGSNALARAASAVGAQEQARVSEALT
jgi:propane monooxygenase small subunit